MVTCRNKGLRKLRSLVINVGTTQKHLEVSADDFQFETEEQETEWEVYNSTIKYWAAVATLRERTQTIDVDYVRDTPETQRLYAKNLEYMGIECTPGTHVDQVMRSTVQKYENRNPQGIFKYKCMMYVMKPFFWATLPFQLVGKIIESV